MSGAYDGDFWRSSYYEAWGQVRAMAGPVGALRHLVQVPAAVDREARLAAVLGEMESALLGELRLTGSGATTPPSGGATCHGWHRLWHREPGRLSRVDLRNRARCWVGCHGATACQWRGRAGTVRVCRSWHRARHGPSGSELLRLPVCRCAGPRCAMCNCNAGRAIRAGARG